jgi:hypothetical protein
MGKKHGKIGNISSNIVNAAGVNTKQNTRVKLNIVGIPADNGLSEKDGETMAGFSLDVKDISKQPDCRVFDIEVEDIHSFIANGILVHNCADAVRYRLLARKKVVKATRIVGLGG